MLKDAAESTAVDLLWEALKRMFNMGTVPGKILEAIKRAKDLNDLRKTINKLTEKDSPDNYMCDPSTDYPFDDQSDETNEKWGPFEPGPEPPPRATPIATPTGTPPEDDSFKRLADVMKRLQRLQ